MHVPPLPGASGPNPTSTSAGRPAQPAGGKPSPAHDALPVGARKRKLTEEDPQRDPAAGKRPRIAMPPRAPSPAQAPVQLLTPPTTPPLLAVQLPTPPATPPLAAGGLPQRPLATEDIDAVAQIELEILTLDAEHGVLAKAVIDALEGGRLGPGKNARPGQYGARMTLPDGRTGVVGITVQPQPDGKLKPGHILFHNLVDAAVAVEVSTGKASAWSQQKLPAELMWQIFQHVDDPGTVLAVSSLNREWRHALGDRRALALFQAPLLNGIRLPGAPRQQPRVPVIAASDDVMRVAELRHTQGSPMARLGAPPPGVPQTVAAVPAHLQAEALGTVTQVGLHMPVDDFRPARKPLITASREVAKRTSKVNPLLDPLIRSGARLALREEDQAVLEQAVAQVARLGMKPAYRRDFGNALTAAARLMDRLGLGDPPLTLARLQAGGAAEIERVVASYLEHAPKANRLPEWKLRLVLHDLQVLPKLQGPNKPEDPSQEPEAPM